MAIWLVPDQWQRIDARRLTSPGRASRRSTSAGNHDAASVLQVAVGGLGGLELGAALNAGAQVWGVPVPPVVRGGGLLDRVVALGRLAQELSEGGDVHRSHPAREPL